MPEYFKITIVCSLLLFLAIPSSAEFYQYVDSKGITHFTDKISTIPTRYQSQLESRLARNTLPNELPYPEYEECRKIASQHQVPLREVYDEIRSNRMDAQ